MIDDGVPTYKSAQIIRRPRCPACVEAGRAGLTVRCYKTKGRTRYYACLDLKCRDGGKERTFKTIVV